MLHMEARTPLRGDTEVENSTAEPLTLKVADTGRYINQQIDNAVNTVFAQSTPSREKGFFSRAKRTGKTLTRATAGEFSRERVRTSLREEMIKQDMISADFDFAPTIAGYKATSVTNREQEVRRQKLQEIHTLDLLQEKTSYELVDSKSLNTAIYEEIIKPMVSQDDALDAKQHDAYRALLIDIFNRPEHKKAVKKMRKRSDAVTDVLVDFDSLIRQAKERGIDEDTVSAEAFQFAFTRNVVWGIHDGPQSRFQKSTQIIGQRVGEKRAGEITAVAAVAGHRLAARETAAVVGAVATPLGAAAAGAVGGALRAGVNAGRMRRVSEISNGYTKTTKDGSIDEPFSGYTERRVTAHHLLHGGVYHLESEYGPPIAITKQDIRSMLADPSLYIGDIAERADQILTRVVAGDTENINFIAYQKGSEETERAELIAALTDLNTALVNNGLPPRRLYEPNSDVFRVKARAEQQQFKKERRTTLMKGAAQGTAIALIGRTVVEGVTELMGVNEVAGAAVPDIDRDPRTEPTVNRLKLFDADDHLPSEGIYKQQIGDVTVTMPQGMKLQPDPSAGANKYDLVTTGEKGNPSLIMDDLTITEDSLTGGTLSTHWDKVTSVKSTTEHRTSTAFEPTNTLNTDEAWQRLSDKSPPERRWFTNDTQAPDGTENGMTVVRNGTSGFRIYPPGGTAHSGEQSLSLDELIQNRDQSYGFYFSRPNGTGIFISAPDGLIIDPHDTTHVYQADIAGSTRSVTSAELTKLLSPGIEMDREFLSIPEHQMVVTENTQWDRIFALDGGHIESVQRIQNPDGTWRHNVTATIHGTGSTPAVSLDEDVVTASIGVNRETLFEVEKPVYQPPLKENAGGGDIDIKATAHEDSDLPEFLAGAGTAVALGAIAAGGVILSRRNREEERREKEQPSPPDVWLINRINAYEQEGGFSSPRQYAEMVDRSLIVMASDAVNRAEHNGTLSRNESADLAYSAFLYHAAFPTLSSEKEQINQTISLIERNVISRDVADRLYDHIMEQLILRQKTQEQDDESTKKQREVLVTRILTMILSEPNSKHRQLYKDLIVTPSSPKITAAIDVLIESFLAYDAPELYTPAFSGTSW